MWPQRPRSAHVTAFPPPSPGLSARFVRFGAWSGLFHRRTPPPQSRTTSRPPPPPPSQKVFWSWISPTAEVGRERVSRAVPVGGTWASQKHSEAGYGRPVDRGVWTAKTVKRPRQQPAHPQYANYWVPLTRTRHTMPHSAQPQHTSHWAPRTRKRHQQEHRPQRPTERSDPTQHAKGRTGDCPGPHKETATQRNVTQGGGAGGEGVR